MEQKKKKLRVFKILVIASLNIIMFSHSLFSCSLI